MINVCLLMIQLCHEEEGLLIFAEFKMIISFYMRPMLEKYSVAKYSRFMEYC